MLYILYILFYLLAVSDLVLFLFPLGAHYIALILKV